MYDIDVSMFNALMRFNKWKYRAFFGVVPHKTDIGWEFIQDSNPRKRLLQHFALRTDVFKGI